MTCQRACACRFQQLHQYAIQAALQKVFWAYVLPHGIKGAHLGKAYRDGAVRSVLGGPARGAAPLTLTPIQWISSMDINPIMH